MAGVWRVGKVGRPLGLVTVEYWTKNDQGFSALVYEFLTLQEDGQDISSADGFRKRSTDRQCSTAYTK